MSSERKSENQIKIFTPPNQFGSGIHQFKPDSQRNSEIDNQQQIMIPGSVNNSVYTPMKGNMMNSTRKLSMNQLSVSRTDNIIIQCLICNIQDDNLIQPCQCENFYHSLCFKQRLQAAKGAYSNQDFQCGVCNVQYKIKRLQTFQSNNLDKVNQIVLFVIKLIITFGSLGGLLYWLYSEVQDPSKMSSLVAIIILLILLLILYLVYLFLELVRGKGEIDWEILDQKQDNEDNINIDELNQIENRQKSASNNQRPQVIQQITQTQYPQISTSEIIQ